MRATKWGLLYSSYNIPTLLVCIHIIYAIYICKWRVCHNAYDSGQINVFHWVYNIKSENTISSTYVILYNTYLCMFVFTSMYNCICAPSFGVYVCGMRLLITTKLRGCRYNVCIYHLEKERNKFSVCKFAILRASVKLNQRQSFVNEKLTLLEKCQ